jgi:hypothetical protein
MSTAQHGDGSIHLDGTLGRGVLKTHAVIKQFTAPITFGRSIESVDDF